MTDKVQTIREEVARIQLYSQSEVLKQILDFIDSLQEEPVSEEFEEALAREWQSYNDRGAAIVDALEDNAQELTFAKGFYRGANWQKQQTLDSNALLYNARMEGMEIGKAEIMSKVKRYLDKVDINSDDYYEQVDDCYDNLCEMVKDKED